jgi:peptidoglycan/xylan/chitin deacetylase (PgdA/CDA1 family)
VMITFDDGYADNFTDALPLLRRYGCPALVFLPTDLVGSGAFPWDPGGAPGTSAALSWDQAREMAASGIAFGSHSKTHPRLTHLEGRGLESELLDSKARIERETGTPAVFFAYPGGVSSPQVADAVGRAGYTAAFTTVPGVVDRQSDRLALRRTEISASDPMPVFALKLSGALDVLTIKESEPLRRLYDRVNRWTLSRLTGTRSA